MSYEPQVFVKNGVERVAKSPAAAVALRFDGYLPKVSADAKASEAPAVSSTPAPEYPEPQSLVDSDEDPTDQEDYLS